IVPLPNADGVWIAPSHLSRPELLKDDDLQQKVTALDQHAEPWATTLALDNALRSSYEEQKPADIASATAKFMAQVRTSPDYMDDFTRRLDLWNTHTKPFQMSAWIYFVAFGAYVIMLAMARRRRPPTQDSGNGSFSDGRTEEYAPGAREYMSKELKSI